MGLRFPKRETNDCVIYLHNRFGLYSLERTAVLSVTNHFSGLGRVLGLVYMCMSLRLTTFEEKDLGPRYLAC